MDKAGARGYTDKLKVFVQEKWASSKVLGAAGTDSAEASQKERGLAKEAGGRRGMYEFIE